MIEVGYANLSDPVETSFTLPDGTVLNFKDIIVINFADYTYGGTSFSFAIFTRFKDNILHVITDGEAFASLKKKWNRYKRSKI